MSRVQLALNVDDNGHLLAGELSELDIDLFRENFVDAQSSAVM